MTLISRPQNNPILVIFTDLDGTLLDSAYTYEMALPALKLVSDRNIPLIICSSKTRAEIELIRKGLGNDHPFVSENGGGIYISKSNYELRIKDYETEELDEYYLIKLGADYADLRRALAEIRGEGFNVRGFGDMSVKEVAELTGLKESDAELAQKRQFDEVFTFTGDEASVNKLKQRINSMGFNYTQGEYFHIMGNSDKGRAVGILKELYAAESVKVITAALGNSPNDIEMLNNVDHPFVVKKEDGSYSRQILHEVKGCKKVDGIGPVGWNKAVKKLLSNFFDCTDDRGRLHR
ncbi:MAG TPA: HAD-IIB family hydrolase [Nitrospirae bacterium]|nr:glucosyl-3-phosphoglycerate/mannosyl-3-phosphoglycerate phosphatase [bacterium BMS3Bbin09]HDN94844.1 HAD-IIB family hydrolase [Nitrospirota bacterium]HDO67087.1 HAD-IIB family hydrolase [Nitrospirota bacterium]HEW81261.1 HAD-IIB family hydrolase [Nitrospirota bacterium]